MVDAGRALQEASHMWRGYAIEIGDTGAFVFDANVVPTVSIEEVLVRELGEVAALEVRMSSGLLSGFDVVLLL